MLDFPLIRLTTSCSNPEDFVNTRTDFSFAPSRRPGSANPAPIRAAVPRNSLRPVMALMNFLSTMLIRMLAAWEGLEDVVSCPPQFPHSGFRGIIRSADPALQILEVVVKSGLLPCCA